MKTALIYASKTGHSGKIANAIAKELNIPAQNISSNPKLENVDLLFIVGGIYGSQSLPELINYIKNLDNGMVKKAVLVTSSASQKVRQEEIRKILNSKNISVIEEEFICKGGFLFMSMKHPNKTDIENAVAFAKKVVH